MKKISVLSLFMVFASTQIYSSANNPPLAFIIACNAAEGLYNAINQDKENAEADTLLAIMQSAVTQNTSLKAQLAAAKDGYISKGTPLDTAKIEAENKDLQENIKRLDDSNDRLKKNGINVAERKKIDSRRADIKIAKAKYEANMKALKANADEQNAQDKAKAEADANAAAVQSLLVQNAATFEQTVENYIASLGQVYQQSGRVYGATTIISSHLKQDMPITPKQYNQLIATLVQGKKINPNMAIDLMINTDSDKQVQKTASLDDVVSYIKNMPLTSTSYSTYAMYTLLTAGVIAGSIALSNWSEGKDLTDTTKIMNAATLGMSKIQDIKDGAYNIMQNPLEALKQLQNNTSTAATTFTALLTGLMSTAQAQFTALGITQVPAAA